MANALPPGDDDAGPADEHRHRSDRPGAGDGPVQAQIASAERGFVTAPHLPGHAGILRAIAAAPGQSQQALSAQLGLLPSRVVAYVDELEDRGYVERRRNPDDRRLYALHLTAAGKRLMTRIGELARQHERKLTAGLSADQRETLRELLAVVADRQGLTPHVHPGFRNLGRPNGSRR